MALIGRRFLVVGLLIAGSAATARAQTTLNGNAIALRSSGAASGTSWALNDNGYVGTYVTLAAPGSVTIGVNAAGTSSGGVAPRMNIAVADSIVGFDVTPGINAYEHSFDLPAGTYFVRTEMANDPLKTSRALSVSSLNVAGASVANANTSANALAAADSYILNYRRGAATLALTGVAPGTSVKVTLRQHDFRFGTAVGGTTLNGVNSFLNNANFSNFLLANFNTITQGNAGKWTYNEATRDVATMSAVDRFFSYAEQHGLEVRLHNMLWGDSQQPGWASTLLTSAAGGNATAKADLRAEISERIDYYVGDGDMDTTDGDRARRYAEMDVLNEHVHQPKYWNTYQASGVASIFTEAADAVTKAGSNARLYLNEYNVLQYGADGYGNWYREDVEELTSVGGAVSGIGVQYYPRNADASNVHSPARIQQVMQNLSVTGLPISLTEFGVQDGQGETIDQAKVWLPETMRMVFGTPSATTFMMWGFATNDVWDQAPLAALMDATTGQPTAVGLEYQALMNQWKTDVTVPVAADGTIDFTGFYGDYDIEIGNRIYSLSLAKGDSSYQLVADLAADFNHDGRVDADDLTAWAQGFEAGVLNGDDLLTWQNQLGLSVDAWRPVPTGVVAPEPAAWALLTLAAAVAPWRQRRGEQPRRNRDISLRD